MVIASGVPKCVAAVYTGRGALLHDTQRALADKVWVHLSRWSSSESFRHGSVGCRSPKTWSQQHCRSSCRKLSVRASADGKEGEYDYDLVTIGAGSGGVRASRIAASFGAKVAICELPFATISSDSTGGVGGTCVLRGCVPKKILVMGSQFSHRFEESREFGWSYESQPTHDWSTLVSNKNKELQRLIGVYKNILKSNNVTLIEGRGKVVDPHTVEISGKSYTARHILVSVGGRASVPDLPGKEYAITSDEALDLPSRPAKICIVGGGYIALEFAGIFNGLGSEVHVVIRQDKVLRGFDEDLRDFLAEQMAMKGIHFHFGESPTAVEKGTDGKFTLVTSKGAYDADAVMFATGRSANTKNLGLEKVGVKLDSKGAIEVDEYSRTNIDSIWAVGDVTNRLNLTPVAIMEGMAFAKTAFADQPTKPDHKFVPSAVFTLPPVACVGLTEAEALTEFGDIDVFTSNFRPMKATISGLGDRTIMKLIVDAASDKVVGVHMCGEDAPEILQGFSVAVKVGLTKAQIDSTVGIHPTAAEELVTMRSPTRKLRQKSSQQNQADKILSPR